MYKRNISYKLQEALTDTPAILLCGARQTGKSTLVQSLGNKGYQPSYISFDHLNELNSAKQDPVGFIENLSSQVILDEVQYVPELFMTIKSSIDKNRKPGRFLLTGSANVLLSPRLSDSLAGRMEIITLWPLSQQEIQENDTDFITKLFDGDLPKKLPKVSRDELEDMILKGGYPEALTRTGNRRAEWFSSYVRAILEKDVREFSDITDLTRFPRILSYLAAQSATLLNLTSVSNAVDIPYSTLQRYLAYLQMTYLCVLIQPWNANLGLRFVKSPKVLLNDTGLLTSLLGVEKGRFAKDPTLFGAVLETFVGMELKKLIAQSRTRAELFHFRTHSRKEIDFIIEARGGDIIGVEVKAASTIRGDEFDSLKQLAEKAKKKFTLGVVLYTGDSVLKFGDNMYALPISALWS
jgi:predicted AAA+ superfamily ATPase